MFVAFANLYDWHHACRQTTKVEPRCTSSSHPSGLRPVEPSEADVYTRRCFSQHRGSSSKCGMTHKYTPSKKGSTSTNKFKQEARWSSTNEWMKRTLPPVD